MIEPPTEYVHHNTPPTPTKGLTVHDLEDDTRCSACGGHLSVNLYSTELPENLETCKGYFKRKEIVEFYIQLYLKDHPHLSINDIELVEKKNENVTRWFIQKKTMKKYLRLLMKHS